jgi:hypothetical protein
LGCTLLIEVDDKAQRDVLLRQWLALPGHLFLETLSGQRIPAHFDERQIGEQRISSVHYIRFSVGDQVPAAVVCTLPEYSHRVQLAPAQQAALAKDLMEVL